MNAIVGKKKSIKIFLRPKHFGPDADMDYLGGPMAVHFYILDSSLFVFGTPQSRTDMSLLQQYDVPHRYDPGALQQAIDIALGRLRS